MKEVIELSDCPENLQQSVNSYLSEFPEVEVLAVQKLLRKSYEDKTITNITYRVFTTHGNYFSVFKTDVCSNPECSDQGVTISDITAGEIAEIISLSPVWLKNGTH